MYDDDDEDEHGKGKFVKNIAKGTAGGVKRVARGTRRMSLLAAGNVKNVAGNVKNVAVNMPGNVKKVAAGTVDGAKQIVSVKKKKKKKKKDKKEKKSKKRGRSESPKRGNNSTKPPVTKPGVFRALFSPKRWRSASPAIGRKNKYESDSESEPVSPIPNFSSSGNALQSMAMCDPAMGDPAMGDPAMGMNGGMNPYATSMNPYNQVQKVSQDTIGTSIQSLSSAQRYQRNQEQEKIERDNQVPFFSLLLKSKHFLKYCDIAFELVDTNGNGVVDETELYAGLLLIHLKLGSFLGPAACKPLSRERCNAMFEKFDCNNSGGLDRKEFRRIMIILFSNIVARVFLQYVVTILMVPLVAKSVLEFITFDSQGWWDYFTKPKALRRMGEEFTIDYFVDWRVTSYPSPRRTFFTKLYRFIRIGSDAFWETFPLTFTTVILGLVIAPTLLYYMDDFFVFALDWKENRAKNQSKRR